MKVCTLQVDFLNGIRIENCSFKAPTFLKELVFDWPIQGIIEFHDLYIILIMAAPNIIYNENVFGISKETGDIVWQIEPLMRPDVDSPFTGIFKEDDKVILGNWNGMEYTVDPNTGKILSALFTK